MDARMTIDTRTLNRDIGLVLDPLGMESSHSDTSHHLLLLFIHVCPVVYHVVTTVDNHSRHMYVYNLKEEERILHGCDT